MSSKPRNRSEWQARFTVWARAESNTEAERIDSAKRRVIKALEGSEFLASKRWSVIPQGSWHNRTNVRSDSDVDLCVCLRDAYFYECNGEAAVPLYNLGLCSLDFSFHQFKAEVQRCLITKYGALPVSRGNKAIHLNKDMHNSISIDIVPTFTFRRYGQNSLLGQQILAEGVALLTDSGILTTNFPEQHLRNGRDFHGSTGRRFKKIVRILKRMRNHLADNAAVDQKTRETINRFPSFFIECMVFNCPLSCFGHLELFDDVVSVIFYLQSALSNRSGSGILSYSAWGWSEVNLEKKLFGNHQPISASQALYFISNLQAYMR